MREQTKSLDYVAWFAVGVAALGYFVDVFDILLFSVVRSASLKSLGLAPAEILDSGIFLINAQMTGMLLGGLLWGVLGDKRGRLSVLFGSIALYSVANILNGFVQTVDQYATLRFLAGLGLAGELGAGVTLAAESLPAQHRGVGTTLIATVGVAGGLAASLVGSYWDWRTAYFIAGGMGLGLLCLRVSVFESKMFQSLREMPSVRRGSLLLLFSSRERTVKYFSCLFAGVPIYFVLGVLVAFAPELGEAVGLGKTLSAASAVFYSYLGFISGDLASGLYSQWARSRKRAILAFIALTSVFSALLLYLPIPSLPLALTIYVCLGFFAGYWAVIVTVAAEQFGTNLRATVATSIPNLVRGMVVPMTLGIKALKPSLGLVPSSALVLALVSALALLSAAQLSETFGARLDYEEK